MLFQTYGNMKNPAVLFFHAMGVTGASSEPVVKYLQDRYFCILPPPPFTVPGRNMSARRTKYGRWRTFCIDRAWSGWPIGHVHFKYRQAVMNAYPYGNYPIFERYVHMQYQIRDPKGFAGMLAYIAERDCMPELPFIRK